MLRMMLTLFCVWALAGCVEGGALQSARSRINATVPDVEGRMHSPLSDPSHKACVLIFITTDCPIANGYAPEIKRITLDYEPRGVTVFLVHADPQADAAKAKQHALEYGYGNTVLLDRQQRLTKTVGATRTPEAAVVSPTGELLYLGRIDDRYAGYGRKREVVTNRELRDALDAVLEGRPVPVARTEAIGCYIPL